MFMICFLSFFVCLQCSGLKIRDSQYPEPVQLADIQVFGHLYQRAEKNFDRLEKGEYLPVNVEYGGEWPGDFPGRLFLGTLFLQDALDREPQYVDAIYADIKKHIANNGYIGEDYGDDCSEQQLFGHSWLIRGLCEHYRLTQNRESFDMVQTIIDSLMLKSMKKQRYYPIDPKSREAAGSYYGKALKVIDTWIVSTDVGANFAILDGLADAYNLTRRKEISSLFEIVMNRFLQVDLFAIQAQTHSTLTALRGMVKYYEITQKQDILNHVEERYHLYKTKSMTENFENYNWFNRPSHTEPCAVIDSYILVMNLWRITGNTEYLNDAQLIYYNGIATEQRANGGFGCNTCTGVFDPFLKVRINEAWWCCTMRGAEGIARKIENLYFTHADTIIVPDLCESLATLRFQDKSIRLQQQTQYPFEGGVTFKVLENNLNFNPVFKIYTPFWMEKYNVSVNAQTVEFKSNKKFIYFSEKLSKGDLIHVGFSLKTDIHTRRDTANVRFYKFFHGPLLLGAETDKQISVLKPDKLIPLDQSNFKIENSNVILKPVYHLMDSTVLKENNYKMQLLFREKI